MADNLVHYLPSDLDAAFKKTMSPDEEVIISLPGAFGEALVVTNRRAAVIREKGPTEGINVFSHLLSEATGVAVVPSITGGMLTVQLPLKVPEEERAVYFATYDKSKFEEAANRINNLISVAHANKASITVNAPIAAPPAQPAVEGNPVQPVLQTAVCPSCGNPVSDKDAFCAFCGNMLKKVCQVCSGNIPLDGRFCPSCGSEAKPANVECKSCGARINASVMSYCPQCGTAVGPKCASCGGAIIPGWPRCRYCGREIGSEGTPGRSVRMQMERQSLDQITSVPEEHNAVEVEAEESPAAEHNAKGIELFEAEELDEAIEEFRRAVTLEPSNASYHFNLAAAYDEAGQIEDARREYERTLELNPDDITALLYLGYLLNENGEQERAAALWRRVIQTAPGTPEAEEAQQNLITQESL